MTAALRALGRTEWLGLALVAIAGMIALALARPAFLSPFNLYVLLTAFSLSVLVALSQAVILAIGQMNLSVGAIGGLAAIAFAGLMEVHGVPPLAAVAAGIAVGALAGLVNGAIIAATGIGAFVVTLATLSIYKGINIGITEAQPFYDIPAVVAWIGNARLGPVPFLLLPAMASVLAVGLLFSRGVLGRQMLAFGGNAAAAELSGIPARRIVVWAHVISGVLAALAGMMAVARLQLGQPTIGDDWLILSFAAPVIGGAVLAGGHAPVIGICLGVVIVTLINNALVLLEVDPFFVQLLLGLLILGAVALNRLRDGRL